MTVSRASVAVATAPRLTVGAPAVLAVVIVATLLIVVVAVDAGDVNVTLLGSLPVTVAELLTALVIPAALLTSVWLKT